MTTPQQVIRAYMFKRGYAKSKHYYGAAQLAREIGEDSKYIAGYINGNVQVSQRILKNIAKQLGINAKRLLLLDRVIRGVAPKEEFGEAMEYFEKDLNGYVAYVEDTK